MSHISHTPGPWVAEINGGKGSWIRGADKNWCALSCGIDDENANANAHLIAAAPELLEALKMFAEVTDLACLVEKDSPQAQFAEPLRFGLNAIAKAEGRQP